MKWNQPVVRLIEERTSTRSYDKRKIDEDSLRKLNACLEEINAEAGIKARFALIKTSKGTGGSGEKLGTYGMISGARSYLLGILDKTEKNTARFGYLFEKIILTATDLGLQTCWLGGSFNREDFKKKAALDQNEFIPIVSPVGYKRGRGRIIDPLIRAAIGANGRKPWEQLFFYQTIDTPLGQRQTNGLTELLEMVRLAPSASNRQPWRVIKNERGYHFFLCRTKGYGHSDFDVQKNDVGIAMCHFELAALESGRTGSWNEKKEIAAPEEWEYIATWSESL